MMYFFDTDKHHLPHIHVKYGEFTCVISIVESEVLQGELPRNKLKLVWAWIELHRNELMANWEIYHYIKSMLLRMYLFAVYLHTDYKD